MATNSKCRRLEGKVAVITGSTAGIGLAIAERLGQEGARVMVSSRKQAQVDAAVQKLKSQGIEVGGVVCHVAKSDDRQRLLQKTNEMFGGIDILVSNAGMNPVFGPIFETTEDSWDKIFDVNVKAAFFLCREAIPYMEKRGGGSIILVSSIGGYVPIPLIGVYCVSKTTLIGLAKAMSIQAAGMNIRVNAIAPGIIKTKFSQFFWNSPEQQDFVNESVPLGRAGVPEDCSGAVAFLASDDSSYMTGETIVVAGGVASHL